MKPTDAELLDRAYLVATGNHLTEDFTYNDFQSIDASEYAWQLVEDWPTNELESHIAGIADRIFTLLKEVRDEQ